MDILIAIAHIFGSVVALTAFGFFTLYVASIELEKVNEIAREDISIALGLKLEELEEEINARKVLEYSSNKFSSDLFQNRISDLCGLIRILWVWMGNLTQLFIFLAACWYTYSDNLNSAIYAWGVVGAAIFFWLTSILFSLACKLLTGRYPGQAKAARKSAANWVQDSELFSSQE
jgi:hypothetical protein